MRAEAADAQIRYAANVMTGEGLRNRLSAICTDRDAMLWLADIERLRCEHPHTIHRREMTIDRGFNCFAFALQLIASPAYKVIASHSAPNVFADSDFVTWLLSQDVLEKLPQPAAQATIIYFDGATPTHAGVVHESRVLSKWGTGWWFEHQLFEVPAGYGEHIEWYAQPTPEDVASAFLTYAELQRVPVKMLLARWLGAA